MESMRQRPRLMGRLAALSIFAVAASFLATGCIEEYDLERPEYERGTLGEELHEIWLKDTRRSATDAEVRTELLTERETEFVSAVDRAVPEGHVLELDQFLINALPVIEAGYFPALSRRAAQALQEAADDGLLMASLEDPPVYGAGDFTGDGAFGLMIEEAVAYERMPELMGHIGQVLLAYDGLDAEGERDLESPPGYTDLMRSIVDTLQKSAPKGDTGGWSTALRDLLIVHDNRYRGDEDLRHNYVALFDDDGLPIVRTVNGEIPAPFTDRDGDGRADTDDEGRFILDNGQMLAIPPIAYEDIDHPELGRFYDGRAQTTAADFVFEYVDISATALPYLVRMGAQLAEQDVLYDASMVAAKVLGPTVAGEDERGSYRAFSEEHPIVDLVDAVLSGLAITELPEVMELTARYITRAVDDIAFMSYALGNAAEIIGDDPNTEIYANETLLFDLLDVIREITADAELWADVMEALRDPILERAGEAMSTLITYRDLESVPEEDGPYDSCFQSCKESASIGTAQRFDCIRSCPNHEIFSDTTDFSAPESEQNRSRFQRLFHLLRDTAGQPYDLEVEHLEEPWLGLDASDFPPMMSLPGAAEAFIRSVAGKLHLSDYISDEFTDSDLGQLISFLNYIPGVDVEGETMPAVLSSASELFGAKLDVEPTPDQITRLFNQEDLRIHFEEEDYDVILDVSNPVCKDGFEMAFHHADGLYASEASGLIDVLYPLAKAFAEHDREDLLAEIFMVVHDHYSGHDDLYKDVQGNTSPMKASNLVSVEPSLQEVFDEGQIFEALRGLALSTQTLTDDDGVPIDERLRQLLHKWVQNDDGYSPRSEPFVIELSDGRQLQDVSRVEVIIDRVQTMIDDADDDQEIREHLVSATESFFDIVLSAEEVGDGEYEFREEGVVALTTHWLRYLGQRARVMEEGGELEPWLTQELPDQMMEFYSSRGFYAGVEVVAALHEYGEGRELMRGVPTHFAESGERADAVSMVLYSLIVQMLDFEALIPVGRFALRHLDPDRPITLTPHNQLPTSTVVAHILADIPDADPEGQGLDIIARGSQVGQNYRSSWAILMDMIVRYFSPEPMAQGPMTAQNRSTALNRIADWIYDDYGGLERFYSLVEQRGNLELEDFE